MKRVQDVSADESSIMGKATRENLNENKPTTTTTMIFLATAEQFKVEM